MTNYFCASKHFEVNTLMDNKYYSKIEIYVIRCLNFKYER